jgi:hypothetical protein
MKADLFLCGLGLLSYWPSFAHYFFCAAAIVLCVRHILA